jgi:hypothetical protein
MHSEAFYEKTQLSVKKEAAAAIGRSGFRYNGYGEARRYCAKSMCFTNTILPLSFFTML